MEYPDSDGEPTAESDFQRKPLTYAVEALNAYYQNRLDVYVSGNILLYYEKGNPQAVVSPDVLVVIGAEKRDRSSYMLWQEPKAQMVYANLRLSVAKTTFILSYTLKRIFYAS